MYWWPNNPPLHRMAAPPRRLAIRLPQRGALGELTVMRFSFLASRCPENCALRAKSQALGRLWQFGHGILWICLLSLSGTIAAWWVSRGEPELPHDAAWSVVAPVLLLAVIGFVVKRYAVKKGGASNASSD